MSGKLLSSSPSLCCPTKLSISYMLFSFSWYQNGLVMQSKVQDIHVALVVSVDNFTCTNVGNELRSADRKILWISEYLLLINYINLDEDDGESQKKSILCRSRRMIEKLLIHAHPLNTELLDFYQSVRFPLANASMLVLRMLFAVKLRVFKLVNPANVCLFNNSIWFPISGANSNTPSSMVLISLFRKSNNIRFESPCSVFLFISLMFFSPIIKYYVELINIENISASRLFYSHPNPTLVSSQLHKILKVALCISTVVLFYSMINRSISLNSANLYRWHCLNCVRYSNIAFTIV